VGHPGFDFTRRSYHTLSKLRCPRAAYYNQLLGVRRAPNEAGFDGPLAEGILFHSLMELYYTHPDKRGHVPLTGTAGEPVLATPDEVFDYYLDQLNWSPVAVETARKGYATYVYHRGDDAELRSRVLWRPEPDLKADLRHVLGTAGMPGHRVIPYQAQYDLIVRLPAPARGVMAVEHKFLKAFYSNTLRLYHNSGQVIGLCALWNSRPDLIERYGPMRGVILNLAFKNTTRAPHREHLSVLRTQQQDYARSVGQQNHDLDTRLKAYTRASDKKQGQFVKPAEVARIWPQRGLVEGACVEIFWTCDYFDICTSGAIGALTYQITEPGATRARKDRQAILEPGIREYSMALGDGDLDPTEGER
jgi:hypothetical protein